MVDYDVHIGGVWAGDSWVVEYEPLRKSLDIPLPVAKHKGYLHRIKEITFIETNKH